MAFHETLITKLAAGKIELFDEKSNSIKSFEINGGYGKMQTEDHLLLIVEN
jgi:F0F1-type ATP synthase epsilon subunit